MESTSRTARRERCVEELRTFERMERVDRWDALADRYVTDSPEVQTDLGPVGSALFALANVRPRDSVLDLGCGPGHLSRYLARLGATVTGVDASPRLLETAIEQETQLPLGIRYVESDAADPTLLDGETFDLVLCSMALSDINDLERTLTNVVRLLAADGRFVFSILHPCFPGTESSRPSWPPSGYFSEGWWLAEGHHGYRGVVGAHHRTLSTYLNGLTTAGLVVDRVAETAFDGSDLPMFLLVRANRRP